MERIQLINHRFLSFIIGLLLISGNLSAQPQRQSGPPPLPDSEQIVEMVDELAETLSLSEEQKSDVSDLYFVHFEEARKLRNEHEGDRENHRQTMDALRDDFEEQVKEILTDEQITEFEVFMKDRQKQRGENRSGRR